MTLLKANIGLPGYLSESLNTGLVAFSGMRHPDLILEYNDLSWTEHKVKTEGLGGGQETAGS